MGTAPLRFPRVLPTVLGTNGEHLNTATVDPQGNVALHTHDYNELVIVWEGSGKHLTPDGSYELGAGNVFLVPPGASHGYDQTNGLVISNIYFDERAIDGHLDDLKHLPGYHAFFEIDPLLRERHVRSPQFALLRESLAQLRTLYRELEQEFVDRRGGYRFMGRARFLTIIGFICRAYQEGNRSASTRQRVMSRAVAHIQSNVSAPLTVREIADSAGSSVSTLQRLFRSELGHSPGTYLRALRIARARDLLATTDFRVTEIAAKCGFADPDYFSRVFATQIGASPRQYRQSNRSNHPPPTDAAGTRWD